MTELGACLPVYLRGPSTTIAKITTGLSGAGVYKIDANGEPFVLKISPREQALADWRRNLHVQRLAAAAGLAPQVVHADEERRAVLSAFVADRSFRALYADPKTRASAIALLGRTLRAVHALPVPPDAAPADPRGFVQTLWSGPLSALAVPPFVSDAVRAALTEPAPSSDRAPVLSHNDVNPTNLIFDGERLLMLDWDTAGPNDPLYDLAVAANFLRMDDGTSSSLVDAYGTPPGTVAESFGYQRRLAAAFFGVLFLDLARQGGHPGASGDETVGATTPLVEVYAGMRNGAIDLASPDGQWALGLAIVRESVAR